jgi:hypothetical protein
MVGLLRTKGTFTSYAHRHLWDSVVRHLDLAKQNPLDSWHLHLSAAFLAAVAFEAYLNYLGEEMLPAIWVKERTFFSQPKYRGTTGKLKRIAEEIDFPLPRKDRKPYKGYCELLELRNKVAHARHLKVDYRAVHREGEFPRLPPGWLEREAPAKRVRGLIRDVGDLAAMLHSSVMKSELRNVAFGAHPFHGALAMGIRRVEAYG